MSATTIEPDTRLDQGNGDDDHLLHLFCECNEDVALCGCDLTGAVEDLSVLAQEMLCVVCDHLLKCATCGQRFEW
jgi:hypothetical protein